MWSRLIVPVMLLGVMALVTACLPNSDAAAESESAESERHALLIGIDDYSGTTLQSLEGPVNDVKLVRGVLRSRFGVPASQIITLTDEQATHTGIRRGFESLARSLSPGDFVYIHYSGHGSYTPDRNGDERSGKDQTWVSYGARSGLTGIDEYDVLDDEVNDWLAPIYEKTENVVFVSDSCHSASVSRGELGGVRAAPQDLRPHPLAEERFRTPSAPGVRIGSARDRETAIELRQGGESYGLFTWFWVESLYGARPGESWEDAFRRTYALVTTKRGVHQRPQLEGEGHRALFGGEFVAPATTVSVVAVDAGAGTVELDVGAVSGATTQSIYRVHRPDSTAAEDSLPSVQLTRVGPYVSTARVLSGELAIGDLLVETEHAYPLEPLRLAIEADFPADRDRQLRGRLADEVDRLEGFERVDDRSEADWIAYILRPRRTDDDYEYAPGASLPTSVPDRPPEVWVISPQEELLNPYMRIGLADVEKGMEALGDNLTKFARIRALKALASSAGPPDVDVRALHLREASPCDGDCTEFPDGQGGTLSYARLGSYSMDALAGAPLRRDDVLSFTMRNDGRSARYLYLLNLGPDGAINALFPTSNMAKEEARFAPGESRDLIGLLLNLEGRETVKLIASSSPLDVRLFEMAGYRSYRGMRGDEDLNPLERLLAEAMTTRGEPRRLRPPDWGTAQAAFPVP